ncbi:nuclease [Recurvomyces mirabilis]|nr:nuclease [Recurvomyces mirabilis]
MSKFTLALVAGASAAVGAATTAAIYGISKRQLPGETQTITAIPSPTRTAPAAPAPLPARRDDPSHPLLPPVDPSGVFQYGFPGPINDLRSAPSLTSAFDRAKRNPHWVAEHITPASVLLRNGDRRHSVFTEDDSIPEKFRGKLKDYFRSGYDRGHQVGDGFNRDYWAHFEDFCRRLTSFYPSVRIVTGPLYLPKRDVDGKWRVSYEVIGHPPNIAVPTHFYKVIFAEDGKVGGNVSLGAFVLPNDVIHNDKPLKDFEVPVEALERASGLEFAGLLPPARTKRLCQEVNCSVIVKEYAERQKTMMSPPPTKGSPPATTMTQK